METNGRQCTSSIKALPIELIEIILDEFDHSELCNFRLISKACATTGASRLFRKPNVSFTILSFRNLLNVSRHPHLAKHVRSVCYDCLELVRCDREFYEVVMREMKPKKNKSLLHDTLDVFPDLDLGWKAYRSFLKAQAYIHRMRSDYVVSVLSLAKFHGLREISIGECRNSGAIAKAYPDLDDDMGELLWYGNGTIPK